jgi:hypothetical protein
MNIFSMDNEDFDKPGYFDLLIRRKAYASLIYSLVSIPIHLIYFLFTALGIIIGFALIPFWIGVPILIGYFRTLLALSKLEEKIYDKYLLIPLPKISKFRPESSSAIILLKAYLKNNRTWNRLIYFLLKIFYSIVFLIPTLLLLALGFSMVYIPIDSVFGHINFYNLYQTDSFIEVIFIYFMAGIAWIGLLHLVTISVNLSSKMAIRFLCR